MPGGRRLAEGDKGYEDATGKNAGAQSSHAVYRIIQGVGGLRRFASEDGAGGLQNHWCKVRNAQCIRSGELGS